MRMIWPPTVTAPPRAAVRPRVLDDCAPTDTSASGGDATTAGGPVVPASWVIELLCAGTAWGETGAGRPYQVEGRMYGEPRPKTEVRRVKCPFVTRIHP